MCWWDSFFSPLSPDSVPLCLSCFLDYTGFQCMNSTAFKLPDLNTGLEHTTWQKRGSAGVNHFAPYCAVKWRRPWMRGHSHFFSASHLLFMNTLPHDWKSLNDIIDSRTLQKTSITHKCWFLYKSLLTLSVLTGLPWFCLTAIMCYSLWLMTFI